MLAHSPAVPLVPSTPVVLGPSTSRRGVFASVTALFERLSQAGADTHTDDHAYWTSIARGL